MEHVLSVYSNNKRIYTDTNYCLANLLVDTRGILIDKSRLPSYSSNFTHAMKNWYKENKISIKFRLTGGKIHIDEEQLRFMVGIGNTVFGMNKEFAGKRKYLSDGYEINVYRPAWKEYASICWYRYPYILDKKDISTFIADIKKYNNFWYPFLKLETKGASVHQDYRISNLIDGGTDDPYWSSNMLKANGTIVPSNYHYEPEEYYDISDMLALRMLLIGKVQANENLMDYLSEPYNCLSDYLIDYTTENTYEYLYSPLNEKWASAITTLFSKDREKLARLKYHLETPMALAKSSAV